jgi:hypothetical protein
VHRRRGSLHGGGSLPQNIVPRREPRNRSHIYLPQIQQPYSVEEEGWAAAPLSDWRKAGNSTPRARRRGSCFGAAATSNSGRNPSCGPAELNSVSAIRKELIPRFTISMTLAFVSGE